MTIPEPSPIVGSAPTAPLCVKLSKILNPSETISLVFLPLILAMNPIPHESCSLTGSYSP